MANIQERVPLNFDSVWVMFQETGKRFQETEKLIRESSQETEKLLKEISLEADKRFKELSLEMKESGRRMEQSKRELDKKMGDLGNRFGELAEHLVAPSIEEKFNALGYHFDAVSPGGMRIDGTDGQALAEVDLLLQNTETMMAVEVKVKPQDRDVDEHLKRLETLRAWADKHRDQRKILGALAGAIMPQGVRQYALNAGLYAIVQSGDTVKIDVPEGFVPRQW
ncbi:MAG: hypothetical protein LBP20_04845 [Treponema sp.]|jgi:hypothetical protein|nr:hypothetical protein [Treponema sp.]